MLTDVEIKHIFYFLDSDVCNKADKNREVLQTTSPAQEIMNFFLRSSYMPTAFQNLTKSTHVTLVILQLWDCSQSSFEKTKGSWHSCWNIWLYTWLWIRVLSGGIWQGCASANRAHLLSWAKSLSRLQPFLLLHTETPALNTTGPAHRILDAVHSPGKIKSMAGKEQMWSCVTVTFHRDSPSLQIALWQARRDTDQG